MINTHNKCIRPIVRKTVIKGTIVLAIFSLFLEITPSRIINYIIFVILWYVLLSIYILWKQRHEYCIEDKLITIRGLTGVRTVDLRQVVDCFISQGILAKHFNCGSIYLVLQNGKVIIIRDIPQPNTYYELLCRGM
ncbi:PH domain-containing protein [Vulcanisaeta distributa]|uniref:YdbS-like PH domain-containing protein n=1 Tax=Vulcanisaeta distributa (strain DSM 14429 / JCM 11212 / NBRC 100878 / IC-017) TaxID=572478 RepID=E1QSG9_VULDI|nr:PH domain-containing protein [Vulcanisaeta distributa]ADN50762.1 conserved hypothetical protein [Vulcanisaeta distributa DSM 14429]